MTMRDALYDKAIGELVQLLDEARSRGERDADAAALATAAADGGPSVRTMTIARVAHSGLSFFADTQSGKVRQLQANPRAAICFHWSVLHYQAIVAGAVDMLSEEESAKLWHSMPRDYTLGHWAAGPEHPTDAESMRRSVDDYRKQFGGERVPLPPSWRAFELKPERIDLWPTGWQRPRQRAEYVKGANGRWSELHLSP